MLRWHPEPVSTSATLTAEVRLLPTDEARDEALVEELVQVINEAYAAGEAGLWLPGATRTEPGEMTEAVRSGGVIGATLDGRIVGCAYVRPLDAGTADLGLISVIPARWGSGVGRQLVHSAEELMRSRGVSTMQLELLVPKGWIHAEKQRLRAWYERLRYRVVRVAPFEEVAAHLESQLATPCEFLVFRKRLAAEAHSGWNLD
jgi:GNAT superfamily N-acetyltransferase